MKDEGEIFGVGGGGGGGRGCSFCKKKNKLKSEIFNDKKSSETMFFSIVTKNYT